MADILDGYLIFRLKHTCQIQASEIESKRKINYGDLWLNSFIQGICYGEIFSNDGQPKNARQL